jgi:hypothetical protein
METIELKLELSYAPPTAAPSSGSEWEQERDYPGVCAVVSLPAGEATQTVPEEIVSPKQQCCNEYLTGQWGYLGEDRRRRERTRTFFAPTLAYAEAAARAWHAEGTAVISSVLSARMVRLAQREATIAAAHAVHGEVTP